MNTRLLIAISVFLASLPWTSSLSAAKHIVKTHDSVKKQKVHYFGAASWYGKQHQGRKMANGQRFDPRKLTAACWYFPLGTQIRVVNVENGESVLVTITDRGPNRRLNRILDLSEAAAERLDYVEKGLTKIYFYPTEQMETESAKLDSHLIEPGSDSNSARGEVLDAGM